MKANKGFTLIELMIVVAIIAIIAAIAIPNLLRARISANEGAAAGSMRTISSSEVSYQAAAFSMIANEPQYGTLVELGDPSGDGTTPGFIDEVLAAGEKQGYAFAAVPTNVAGAAYTATAEPLNNGRTGVRHFFVDESGVIRFASGVAADEASTPLQ